MRTSGATHLVSYWEGPVSWLERLCLASMLDAGHAVTLFSCRPDELAASGLHADVRDAREVMADTHLAHRYRESRQFEHFADVFRLELLRQGRGVWVDLDCLMLRPLQAAPYLFGRFDADTLNNAVLGLPQDSAMLLDYAASVNAVPLHTPWAPTVRRLRREVAIFFGQALPGPEYRTNIGPRALTYFARKHGVMDEARPPAVFYPFASAEAHRLVDPDDRAAQERISPTETVLVHAWQGNLRHVGALAGLPPASSYLGKACARYGV